MTNQFTSQLLSKEIADAGFKGESEMYWNPVHDGYGAEAVQTGWELLDDDGYTTAIPAYDLIHDLCIKYAVEVWGEGSSGFDDHGNDISLIECHSETVLYHLQQGKKQDAERYIREHSILFNNN